MGLAHGQTALALRNTIDDTQPAYGTAAGQIAVADPNLQVDEQSLPRKRQTVEDAYAPPGVGNGGLRFYPALSIGGVAKSNVSASPSHAKGDAGFSLRPSLRVDSDWVRHSWTAGASGDFTFYGDNGDRDSQNLDVFQRLRIEVRRDTIAMIDSSYSRGQTGLENSDVPASATGFRTDHALVSTAGVSHDFGGIEAKLKGGATWRSYEDVRLQGGGLEDNSDRDYVEPSLSLRTTFTDPPVFKPYVEAAFAPRLHQRRIDRNGLQRDSDGNAAFDHFETSVINADGSLTNIVWNMTSAGGLADKRGGPHSRPPRNTIHA